MIADQSFYDTYFTIFYTTASATAYSWSFSEPNIWLRPKVKIAPTVQHCMLQLFDKPDNHFRFFDQKWG